MSEEKVVDEQTPVANPQSIQDLKRKMNLTGTVERLELYGAFIDVGFDVTALIHISQLSSDRVNRVTDVLDEGDEVTVWVDKIDVDNNQIMVTMVEPLAVDWNDLKKGQVYTGSVTRLENFGAFVDIGAEREGLVHISELSHDYVKHPSEVAKVGDEVEVQVLGFSKRKRRIDLSMKALMEKPEPKSRGRGGRSSRSQDVDLSQFEDEPEELPTAMELALRKAMGGDSVEDILDEEEQATQKKGKRGKGGKKDEQEELLNRTLQLQD